MTTWLAVGGAGTDGHSIIRSTDLTNWSSIPKSSINGVHWNIGNSVAHNGTTWVLVGDGTTNYYYSDSPILYSQDDGFTWYPANINVPNIRDFKLTFIGMKVKWNGSVFMVGGNIAVTHYQPTYMVPILQSTDGINWEPANNVGQLGQPGNFQVVYDVNWIDGQWYACGFRSAPGNPRINNELLVAGSGTNPVWSKVIMNNSDLTTGVPYRIAGTTDHKIYIALLNVSKMIYSTDGDNWNNSIPKPLDNSLNDMFQNSNSQVIAVGRSSSGPIVYTTNSNYWFQATNSTSVGDLATAVFGKGSNYLVGGLEPGTTARATISKSIDNGHSWISVTIPPIVRLGTIKGFGATYDTN